MTAGQDLELTHFTIERDRHDVAWLTMDVADSTVNHLASDVLHELGLVLDRLATRPPAGLVILSGKESGFIAGASLDEFGSMDNTETALALVTRGWHVFERLAEAPYPTLALIRGHCLGGGLELALACRLRLAVDQEDTGIALPEVRLGIVPAWGGMMRLPRLIGPMPALDLMLSGKTLTAGQAASLGLVDAAVPPRLARQAAGRHILHGAPRRRTRRLNALMNHAALRPLIAYQTRKTINRHDPFHHYDAPRTILDMWVHHNGNPLKSPDQIEALAGSPVTRNLMRVFHLQERLKHIASSSSTTRALARVHIVGAGVMGGDIAAWCALKGLYVTVQDQDRETIATALGRAGKLFSKRLKDARLVRAAADRLVPDPDGHGLRHADIVLEAIIEDADAKKALYAELEPRMRPDAILATNTSSLSLTGLAQHLARPERLVGIHFFNPVARMLLIEVIEHPGMDADVRDAALAFVHQIGKLPLPVQDSPGFLVNAVLAPYMLEAMRCVDEGTVPAAVDQSMLQFGMPMGPLELADSVGLDIVAAAGKQLTDDELPTCLRTRIERNQLGKKTGQGFYAWTGAKVHKPDAPPSQRGLAQRLVQPLIDRTRSLVEQGVVADDDLADAGLIFGTGFAPFRGGPLHYAASQRPGDDYT